MGYSDFEDSRHVCFEGSSALAYRRPPTAELSKANSHFQPAQSRSQLPKMFHPRDSLLSWIILCGVSHVSHRRVGFK